MKHNLLFYMIITCFTGTSVYAQILDHSWKNLIHESSEEWYASAQAREVADMVLLYQHDNGGWPKNIHPQWDQNKKEIQKIKRKKDQSLRPTIDNGATTLELLFLTKIYNEQPNEKYHSAILKGIDYLLEAQYENGGWPQFYPYDKDSYNRHITFNDDAMVNVLTLLKSIKDKKRLFSSLAIPTEQYLRITRAFNKGIDCILQTQYQIDGTLTAWCAQHHATTLLPVKARSYELPSLSGSKSAKIVQLLMSIERPSTEVIDAVKAAVYWFQDVKIEGLREVRHYNDQGVLIEKTMIPDSDAKPIWARFMDLDDNTPFFCDRDGIKKRSITDISVERRIGYAWYVSYPQDVLDTYKTWLYRISKSKKKKKDLYEMVVAKDGSGDFTTIQDAIYHAKSFPYQRVTIRIKKGIYHEKVLVPAWNPMVSLIGEHRDSTIIRFASFYDRVGRGRNSTFFTATLEVEGNDFYASNITIENNAGDIGQALAVSVHADRIQFENCTIKGYQDTFYAAGEGNRSYVSDCRIEGSTDFIFGEASVLFSDCDIVSLTDSYITAASTPQNIPYGFVFVDCRLKAKEGVSQVYLGRPWRQYAKTIFINCEMGPHIVKEGWHNWGNEAAESSTFYAEYGNTGLGANKKHRVPWSHQLTEEEVESYTIEKILGVKHYLSKNKWYEKAMDK